MLERVACSSEQTHEAGVTPLREECAFNDPRGIVSVICYSILEAAAATYQSTTRHRATETRIPDVYHATDALMH